MYNWINYEKALESINSKLNDKLTRDEITVSLDEIGSFRNSTKYKAEFRLKDNNVLIYECVACCGGFKSLGIDLRYVWFDFSKENDIDSEFN